MKMIKLSYWNEIYFSALTHVIYCMVVKFLGETDEDVIDYRKMLSAGVSRRGFIFQELAIIIKHVNAKANGGKIWIPYWDNKDERKWWVYWNMTTSGFGVSHTDDDSWVSYTAVGSRLVFKSESLALSTANENIEKFKEFLKPKNKN